MEVRPLAAAELAGAAALLGRGMRDNPLHIAAFGVDPERRRRALTRMFVPALRGLHGRGLVLGAFTGGALAGVCGMAAPGRCQPTPQEKLRALPGMVLGSGPGATGRVLQWVGAWSRRDPRERHWHLGPVAVDAHLQGKGIGSELMTAFCARVDGEGAPAYLETDKRENVRFYERAGFTLTAEGDVLGMPNWFMTRPAARWTGA
jgi:GNAT superfamily N-acetyltransferase